MAFIHMAEMQNVSNGMKLLLAGNLRSRNFVNRYIEVYG